MKIAVVYESWFGNTRRVGEAVAKGFREEGAEVVVLSVDDPLPPFGEFDLVVVGAPTHVHGCRFSSRALLRRASRDASSSAATSSSRLRRASSSRRAKDRRSGSASSSARGVGCGRS
jgi:menaquinone-dependent protoporphyrinogen IX oxidase